MNAKKAKALRKMLDLNLGKDTELKEQGHVEVDTKYIGVISHDGNHDIREEKVFEARTHPDRYMYRQLKKIYTGSLKDVDVQKKIKEDIRNNK